MVQAMGLVGNPSSVHAEGRAAKSLVETARAQVAALVGCERNQVVFTSGATEAAALAVAQKHRHGGVFLAMGSEHDCLLYWSERDLPATWGKDGKLGTSGLMALLNTIDDLGSKTWSDNHGPVALVAISAANSETGMMLPGRNVVGNNRAHGFRAGTLPFHVVSDITQVAGKAPIKWEEQKPAFAILSAHKLGGPKGVGALINFTAEDPAPMIRGGGQEMGRRSGTENIIGIAGFGAAAETAARDLAEGRWEEVAQFRNILENALAAGTSETIFVGKDSERLPNTSCFATPGWKGETQVMQMDLAGFAISAGSACSSGKVRASKVLTAMGFADDVASSAIRVSLGLETMEDDVLRFAEAWLGKEKKHRARIV